MTESQHECLPGAKIEEIVDVCMPNIVDHYDTPGEVPEWLWIEAHACYAHVRNGEIPHSKASRV